MASNPKGVPWVADRPTLEIRNLTVAYRGGEVALDDVSLHLAGPRIVGLVGMNGSGKSTLFKAVMGLVAPVGGTVRVANRDIRSAQRASLVAYVPQAEEVDWTFPVSVRDVATMGRQGRMNRLRIPTREDRRIVAESLERVGMTALADRQIGELSGGQRKRAFLARALAQEASIILLDEPFAGVDLGTQAAITAILRELPAAGRLLLVSTHDLPGVPTLCDDVVLLRRRLVAAGPVATTFTAAEIARAFGGIPPGLDGTAFVGSAPAAAA